MHTRKLWLLFLSVKGAILLAAVSFVAVHYMIVGDQNMAINKFDNGLTPLMYAAQKNDLKGIQNLIKQGADLDLQATRLSTKYKKPDNSPQIDGNTALHMACSNIDSALAEDMIRTLVDAGANVRIFNTEIGNTPLHSAAFISTILDDRFLRVIERLVKNGADINAQNGDGDTLLHVSVVKRRSDWIDALRGRRFGALVDQTIKNKQGKLAAEMIGVSTDNWKKDLRPPVFRPGERDDNGLTGLMIAVIRGDEDYVKRAPSGTAAEKAVLDMKTLTLSGKNYVQDGYGYTALHLAILHQRPGMVKVLLEKGANPNEPDQVRDCVKTLCLQGTLTPCSLGGATPLLLVYKLESPADRSAVVNMLAAAKANLNAQDACGNTLLHYVVMHNDLDFAKELMKNYGKQLSLKIANKNTDTPGQLAKRLGFRDMQNLLGA